MSVMMTSKISTNTGNRAIDMWFAMMPNNGGTVKNPIYAKAICIPIILWDLSLPNMSGVMCMMHGYTGALPNPITTNPIKESTEWNGKMTSRIPAPIIPNPNEYLAAIINFLLPILLANKLNNFFCLTMDEELDRNYNKKYFQNNSNFI